MPFILIPELTISLLIGFIILLLYKLFPVKPMKKSRPKSRKIKFL